VENLYALIVVSSCGQLPRGQLHPNDLLPPKNIQCVSKILEWPRAVSDWLAIKSYPFERHLQRLGTDSPHHRLAKLK